MVYFLFSCVFLLTYLRPVEAFFPDLAETRVVLIVTIIAFIATALTRMSTKETRVFSRTHIVLMIVLIFAIFASNATNGWLGGAFGAVISFAFGAVFFMLVGWNVTTLKKVKSLAFLFSVCGTILAGASVAAYHIGFMADRLVIFQSKLEGTTAAPVASPAEDVGGLWLWRIRSLGFLSDPNDFAQFLLMAVIFSFALMNRKKWVSSIIFTMPAVALMGYAIYLTHSRGAVLGAGMGAFLLMQKRFGLWKTALVFLPPALAAIQLGLVGGERGFSASEESAGGRIAAWSEGLLMLRSHPIFGVGYDRFLDFHVYTAHNAFVLCFAELGLVGYFTWLGLIVFVLLGLITQSRRIDSGKNLEIKKWISTITLALVVFLTCSFFLSRTYSTTLYILLAMGAAITAVSGATGSPANTGPIKPSMIRIENWPKITLALVITSIVMFYTITRFYWNFV